MFCCISSKHNNKSIIILFDLVNSIQFAFRHFPQATNCELIVGILIYPVTTPIGSDLLKRATFKCVLTIAIQFLSQHVSNSIPSFWRSESTVR